MWFLVFLIVCTYVWVKKMVTLMVYRGCSTFCDNAKMKKIESLAFSTKRVLRFCSFG
jgi:hypothetical protein